MFRDDLNVRIHRADEKIAALKTDIDLFCENQQPNIQITPQGARRFCRASAALPPVLALATFSPRTIERTFHGGRHSRGCAQSCSRGFFKGK